MQKQSEKHKRLHNFAAVSIVIFGTYIFLLLLLFIFVSTVQMGINWSSPYLWLGLIGTSLAFIGNGYSMDALTRYGAATTYQWQIGNLFQSVGFMVTLFALFASTT